MRIKHRYYKGNVHAVSCPPSSGYWECSIMQCWMLTHSPSGRFQLASYSLPVMSSMVGPEEEVLGPRPLRINLPMEVVTVSTYVRPVASSFTTWLELMLEIPRVITSPIDRGPTGTSWSSSMSSGIFNQVVTPVKPHGGVGGLTCVNALVGGEGSGREGALGRWIGDFTGVIHESWWDLPLGLEVWVGWGSPQQWLLAKMGVALYPIPQTLGFFPWVVVPAWGVFLECQWGKGLLSSFPPPPQGQLPLGKTSSLVKVRYHFTSSLSSNTLSANKWGSPPVGRSFCSTQYWRALAYATTFSLRTSLMSQLVKIESASGINLCQQRHGRAGGAWRVALPVSSSCNCRGSLKDALTCLASFLVLSSPGTVDSSIHQLGVLHLSAFHWTHSAKSNTVSSGAVFLPSLSDVSGDPCRKEATAGFSSGSSPKSESPPSDPSSPDGISRLVDWLGASSSAKLTWWHLFFCPSPFWFPTRGGPWRPPQEVHTVVPIPS